MARRLRLGDRQENGAVFKELEAHKRNDHETAWAAVAKMRAFSERKHGINGAQDSQ